QLVAGASAEGDAAITVTNAQGQIANGVVTVPFGNISFAAPVSFLYGLAYDEITGNLLSLKNSDGTVYIHDGISENVGSTIDIGTSVNDIAVFGGNLYSQDVPLTDFKKFVGISATVDSSFDSDSLGLNYCLCVEFNAAGDMITMALDDDTARQHTGFSGTIEDSFAITANMVGGTIDRDTGNVILSDWSTDMITVFDGFSDTVLDSFPAPVSGGCYGMVVVDGNLITTGGGRIYLHDGISEYTGD
ncbi:MAG: hypothetical protein KAV87_37330, partial [Desulfobacteraceae bacterium]|nr:hypothetical protein [Desulfobacteraceae bacterium]